jgi:N-acetylneuraminate lyase
MSLPPVRGLVPAAFTPLHPNGDINLDLIPQLTDHLISHASAGLYVCGSTGEGPLLSVAERQTVAKAYVDAAAGRVPIIVQVGHESLREAATLAAHAAEVGAAAISAVPPTYFKPGNIDALIDSLAEITHVAPDLPFYYYHIPERSGVALDMVAFLEAAEDRLPTLAGIKFSSPELYLLQACQQVAGGKYDILFGVDEMLVAGLASGVRGAVGSTYNMLAPLYHAMMAAHAAGDREKAEQLQGEAVTLVLIMLKHGGLPAIKACMKLIGLDCGPTRLPLRTLDIAAHGALEQDLRDAGYFNWTSSAQVGNA